MLVKKEAIFEVQRWYAEEIELGVDETELVLPIIVGHGVVT